MLAWFSLLVAIFIPFNIVKLLIIDAPWPLIRFGLNAIMLTGAIVSFGLLFRGKVQAAGSALVLILVFPIHALLLVIPEFQQPLSAATTLFVYDMVCLLIALVFASRLVAWVVFGVCLFAQVAFHFSLLGNESIPGSMQFAADTLLRDGLISMGFVFALGIVLAILIETAHRQNERNLKEIKATNENLESLVAERTRELEIATHIAKEASRAKGEFLANMSHELRTPLHAIIASSELLLSRNDLPPGAEEKARLIASSGDLLLRQIGDILDISKIEAGQIEVENRPFDLDVMVKDCVELMAARAESAGLKLRSILSPTVPNHVRGDEFRLRQILLNLISNAIKFTPSEGCVDVRVITETDDGHPGRVRFEVEDSGIGMDDAALGKIFQRFNQADASTTRKFGGTGLGLAICLNLVGLMGGRLEARSTPGVGSVFFFSLNLEVAGPESAPEKNQTKPMGQLDLFVLAVDDNPVNRKVVGMQLEKLGCRFNLLTNGAEVLEALQTKPLPDLILMDCEMPVLNGWDTTRQLRAWAHDPEASDVQKAAARLPVIALTAATLSEEREKCIACGMTDFLSKPLKLAGLQSMLERVFSDKSSA